MTDGTVLARKPFNMAVLKEFAALFDFRGKSLDEAFRFALPHLSHLISCTHSQVHALLVLFVVVVPFC